MLTQWIFMCAGSTNVYFYLGVSREAKICKLSLHGALCMSLPREWSGFHSALLGGPWGLGRSVSLQWSLHGRLGMTWFLFSSSLIIYDAGWTQEESCSKTHPLEKGAPPKALLLGLPEFPSAVSLRSNAALCGLLLDLRCLFPLHVLPCQEEAGWASFPCVVLIKYLSATIY